MNTEDRTKFGVLLLSTLTLYGREDGKPPSKTVLDLWWGALQRYSYDAVHGGFSDYVKTARAGRYSRPPAPVPGDIIAQITVMDGRPTADEAWAIALQSFDESQTVCVTPEILTARAAAMPIMNVGDKIGARMAFRAAYERAVNAVRKCGTQAEWTLSLGHDEGSRAQAAQRAVALGQIPHARVAQVLIETPKAEGPAAAIAGLLSGPGNRHADRPQSSDGAMSAAGAAWLAVMRSVLTDPAEEPTESPAARRKAVIDARRKIAVDGLAGLKQ